MARVVLYPWFLGTPGTELITGMARKAVSEETVKIHIRAERYLAAADSTVKIADPSGLTSIHSYMEGNDGVVEMWGYKNGALAIEFGHSPSGVFAGTNTKAPEGLYILTRAAGLA